jgi:hypothetical protein
MEIYTAKVRINSRHIIEVQVLANSKKDANARAPSPSKKLSLRSIY